MPCKNKDIAWAVFGVDFQLRLVHSGLLLLLGPNYTHGASEIKEI